LNEESLLRVGEKAITGGLDPNILKKDNGVRLGFPSSERDETKAMGLGPIPPIIIRCTSTWGKSLGSK